MTHQTKELLAYSVKQRRPEGAREFMPYVVIQCGRLGCTNRWEKPKNGLINNEALAKAVNQAGWDYHLHNAAKSRCPDCVRSRELARAGESGKVVKMLGQEVVMPKAIVPAPAPRPHYLEPLPEEKPVKEYVFRVKTTRGMAVIAGALEELAEIVLMKPYVPSSIPEHVQPSYEHVQRSQPIMLQHVPVAEVPQPEPEREPDIFATAARQDSEDGRPKKRVLHFSPEAMANKKLKASAAAKRRREEIINRISDLYLQNPKINTKQMLTALNAQGPKPIGRGFEGGWQKVQLDKYLAELGINLGESLILSRPHRQTPTRLDMQARRPTAHAGGLGDD